MDVDVVGMGDVHTSDMHLNLAGQASNKIAVTIHTYPPIHLLAQYIG